MSEQVKIDALAKHDPAKMALSIVADVAHVLLQAVENGQEITCRTYENSGNPNWLGGPCEIVIKVLPK